MKTANILTGLVLSIMLVASVFAIPGSSGRGLAMGAEVDYGDIVFTATATAAGYLLAPSSDENNIKIKRTVGADITTEGIVFTNAAGVAGVYYLDGERLVKLTGTETRLDVLGRTYTLSHKNARDTALSGAGLATGAYVLETTANYMSTGEGTFTFFRKVVFPDDGSEVLVKDGAGFATKELPFFFVFNDISSGVVTTLSEEAEEEVERGTAGRASREGALPEEARTALGDEPGCFDIDEEDEKPEENPSYVAFIKGDGMSGVAVDNCVLGDKTFVQEAYCADGEERIRHITCAAGKTCELGTGACLSSSEVITKVCVDGDNSPTSALVSGYKERMDTEAKTKSNTVGYYAGSDTPFGAWNDYCLNDKVLMEYYCSGSSENIGLFREIICPNGCSDGKCDEPPYCHDTDGGQYENVKGKLRAINAEGIFTLIEDTCKDSSTVNEHYCDITDTDAGYKLIEKTCGEGKSCINGRCTIPSEITCNRCDTLNPFNIWIGTSCSDDGTASAEVLARCPAGTHCDASKSKCVVEPVLVTDRDVENALKNRRQWARLLDDASGWYDFLYPSESGSADEIAADTGTLPPGTFTPATIIDIGMYSTNFDLLADLFREAGESGPASATDVPPEAGRIIDTSIVETNVGVKTDLTESSSLINLPRR
ncbi:MAG: hypothetical protein PHO02_00645 [Candidatus Nanoarchaeia archaeon]|nr:hypothetical protein [Candidatus Nanoarchaeia archaeon]